MAKSREEIEQIFASLEENFDPAKVEGLNVTVQFDLSGDNGGQYWVQIADGTYERGEGTLENPTMTIKASADNYAAVVNGELNPMQAFMSGKIKINGDMSLALKLQSLIAP